MSIPDAVRERVAQLGPQYAGWLERAPHLVAECAELWGVEVGYAVDSFSQALVVRGRRGTEPVVIKVWPQQHRFVTEERVLRAAEGRGYALLLEADASRNALLLEALGEALELPPTETGADAHVLEVVTRTLMAAWTVPVSAAAAPDAHPAAVLRGLIEANPPPVDVPDCQPAIERALLYAQHRLDDSRPEDDVLLHGDPVPSSFRQVRTLRPGAESGHVLISPHGLRGERECDLGVMIREGTRPLLHAEDAVVLVRGWCAHLAELTGADAELIWQWGYLQRVAHGLALVNGPAPLSGRIYLQTAMALIDRTRR
nr:hypothetical protein [Propionibacterium sp.]